MATPEKRPTFARIEFITLLLLAAIVVVVIIPKLKSSSAQGSNPAQNTPKQPAPVP